MTQEEKQLLFKDLCARLPYKTICKQVIDGETVDCELSVGALGLLQYDTLEIKPYLRPMSSMTEEEEKVFNDFLEFQAEYVSDADLDNKTDMYDWLLSRHLDFRGLIPMGLALEAPEGMYKTE